MNICTMTSKEYSKYAYVMISSLAENNRDESINLYYLYRDESIDFGALEKALVYDHLRVIPVFVNQDYERKLCKIKKYNWNEVIWLRWSLFDILPEHVDRVLFLGVDMYIRGNIFELYQTQFENDKFFAMCPDMYMTYSKNKDVALLKEGKKHGIKYDGDYYNVEVSLIDLKKLRKKMKFDDLIIRAENEFFLYADQDVLNFFFNDKIQTISTFRYNYVPDVDTDIPEYSDYGNAAIIHYAGSRIKPWNDINTSWYNKIWWDMMRRNEAYFFDSVCSMCNYKNTLINCCSKERKPGILRRLVGRKHE